MAVQAATAGAVLAAPGVAGGAWLLALPVAAFIVVFLAWPVATVLYTAFADGHGDYVDQQYTLNSSNYDPAQ